MTSTFLSPLRIAAVLAGLVLLSTAGCSNMNAQQQRALSGGALGAAGGLAISAVAGGPLLLGGLLGGATGAAVGAVTTK